MDVYGAIKRFVDAVLKPPIAFLDMAIERLTLANSVVARGLNFQSYLGVFGDLPTAWQLVIMSITLSGTLLGGLIVTKLFLRLYFAVKGGVKWW